MEIHNVKKYNIKKLLVFLIIFGLLIANLYGYLMSSYLIGSEMSVGTIDFGIIDVPLALSPKTIKPPSANILAAAAARAKLVFDAKTEKSIFDGEAVTGLKMPAADGKSTVNNAAADIDFSNAAQGYVMVKYKKSTANVQKVVQVIHNNSKVFYSYFLNVFKENEYMTFPLAFGNGSYTVNVCEQVGTKYAGLNSATFDVKIADEKTQFLYPGYLANYTKDSKATKMAKYICKDMKTELQKVEKVYNYVIDNIVYDYELAEKVVNQGFIHIPVIDNTMTTKKGICFDYASLMTSMLRSQGVPTKLVMGYTSGIYHAWINVFVKDVGWVDGAIQFDGKTWKLMDPTFAASSSADSGILDYIGDGNNYTTTNIF